jgi:hypothetical protein
MLSYYELFHTASGELVFLYNLASPDKEQDSCRRDEESFQLQYFIVVQGSDDQGYLVRTGGQGLPNEGPEVVYANRADAMKEARRIYNLRHDPVYVAGLFIQQARSIHQRLLTADKSNLSPEELRRQELEADERVQALAEMGQWELLLLK